LSTEEEYKLNDRIRIAARQKRVPLWEIASRIGISESTMTRLLRQELSEEKTQDILSVINEVARERVI
jgi:hypothetical protein